MKNLKDGYYIHTYHNYKNLVLVRNDGDFYWLHFVRTDSGRGWVKYFSTTAKKESKTLVGLHGNKYKPISEEEAFAILL